MYSAISACVSKSREAARATHMIHDGDVIVIAYHAGTKTWHKLPDVFFPAKYGWLARLHVYMQTCICIIKKKKSPLSPFPGSKRRTELCVKVM